VISCQNVVAFAKVQLSVPFDTLMENPANTHQPQLILAPATARSTCTTNALRDRQAPWRAIATSVPNASAWRSAHPW
jgi:hypothetical protein